MASRCTRREHIVEPSDLQHRGTQHDGEAVPQRQTQHQHDDQHAAARDLQHGERHQRPSSDDGPAEVLVAALIEEVGHGERHRRLLGERVPGAEVDGLARRDRPSEERGLEVIIAGAGGAAHLPGMVAAHTVIPVVGVPVQSKALNGLDSLLSIVQMPKGVPVATVAIGNAGNAALLAIAILATSRPDLRRRLQAYRDEIAGAVRGTALP